MGRLALPARLTYYVQGRLPYALSLAEVMQDTRELGPPVHTVVGVDPDAEMIAEAQHLAERHTSTTLPERGSRTADLCARSGATVDIGARAQRQ